MDQLNNTDILKNGKPSNTFFTYQVAAYDDYTHFECSYVLVLGDFNGNIGNSLGEKG